MIEEVLKKAVDWKASDIILIAGLPVSFKVNGRIARDKSKPLTPTMTQCMVEDVYAMADNRDINKLRDGDDDFSFSVPSLSRFRVNALRQRGSLGLVIRVVTFNLPNRFDLGIPDNVMEFAQYKKGLVLITGAAGSGKSTTLACLVDEINRHQNAHIITIEDPIEYIHRHKESIVTQRELSSDTVSYEVAIRSALREAPDIILLGEMRDAETIQAAVTAAETGHLIFSTLHTMGAANSIDRIIDVFPPEQQPQIRTQLSLVLVGVASQQLMPTVTGEIAAAFEVMKANTAIRNLIREAKSHQLDNVISTAAQEGMISMDRSILNLVSSGRITPDVAVSYSVNHEWMQKNIRQLAEKQKGLEPLETIGFTQNNTMFRVCVDHITETGFSGRVFSQMLKEPLTFSDHGNLFLSLDDIMDTANYPKAFMQSRSFTMRNNTPRYITARQLSEGMTHETVRAAKGNLLTFSLSIRSRRNSTWQGTVIWNRQEEPFESALELIRILDQNVIQS